MVCVLFHKSYFSCSPLSVGRCFLSSEEYYLFFADVTDPVADVLSFIRLYEENYGYDHPVFYQGTYSQALNDAKQELRFLLVYLHCEEHQDTAKFCRWHICACQLCIYEYIDVLMNDVVAFPISKQYWFSQTQPLHCCIRSQKNYTLGERDFRISCFKNGK
jgi:hypothetical protein